MSANSQKFIARNRAPRVHIEYDVELYGSSRKMQIPFVMGVLSDLSGKPADTPVPVADRTFLEIDADSFDDRMKSMRPRVAFVLPDTLTGSDPIGVDLTFTRLADFEPDAIARRIPALAALLEARTRLKDLLTYMDGKVGAETLLSDALQNTGLLQTLAARLPAPDRDASEVVA